MRDEKIIGKRICKREISTRFAAWLIFLSIVFGSLPASFARQRSGVPSDLVFCPIQKMWVQKYVPRVKIKEPLGAVCASAESKSLFFFETSKKFQPLRDREKTEKLFFDYLKRGKRAFAEIAPESPNRPESQILKLANSEKSGVSETKTDFHKIESEIFVFAGFARPPTARTAASLESEFFPALDAVARRIQPRAPPVSF